MNEGPVFNRPADFYLALRSVRDDNTRLESCINLVTRQCVRITNLDQETRRDITRFLQTFSSSFLFSFLSKNSVEID